MYQSGIFLALFGTLGFGFMWLFVIRGGYRQPTDGDDEEDLSEIEL
jgi:PPP family 3-phenylpropionic acid transporter